jgi:Animal haem peroxidase/Catalase
MRSQPAWAEAYQGGSAETERLQFEKLARDIMRVQVDNRGSSHASAIRRGFHAKVLAGVTNAKLRILDDIPEDFRVGYVKPRAEYYAIVRLSNANGASRADAKRDMRGLAVRIKVSDKEYHDLLATNFPVSHARDARQFVAFARAMAGSKLLLLPRLFFSVGPFETIRMFRNVLAASRKKTRSLALETYWSRGAVLWGEGPVRYLWRPARGTADAPDPASTDPDYLHHEIANRLRGGDLLFDLCVQPYIDEKRTPIEDASIEWTEKASAPVRVATLTIPKQDIDAAEGRATERLIDQVAFNPWHTTEHFRPLGNLNRARKAAYGASSAHRLGYKFFEVVPLRNRIFGGCATIIFKILNRFVPWYKFDWHGALLNLSVLREELRAKNLIDTEVREAPPKPEPAPSSIPEDVRTVRTFDGKYNDLSDPKMGSVDATFGRMMPATYRPNTFDLPDPILVSRELMLRKAFIPARSLNMLAAAWIQFQVHDWVDHKRPRLGAKEDIVLPLSDGREWRNTESGPYEPTMRIAGNTVQHWTLGGYPVFQNITTPWWDGSEVYGNEAGSARLLRDDDGKGALIRLEDGYLPDNASGLAVTGFNESWWLGLSMLHTLFAREHNVLCNELCRAYPDWLPERIYQTARLIVSALIAKIHTVEWTPAILATKPIDVGLHANWYGAPKDWLSQLGLWLLDEHALKGIPQTLPNHHSAPYSLTEEFTAVYRLHPLIPDDYEFFDFETGRPKRTCTFDDIQGPKAEPTLKELRLHNTIYSFGVAHPGAIALHNYPKALQHLTRPNGEIIDLSVVDIVRDRRRGVPRFNDFREGLHKPRIRRWEDLNGDPETVRIMRDLYRNIDMVDTMVGLHAEPPPEGFGFSDTAFRVFILMASRRLQSDRFFTVDYRPEIYSPLGLDWIDKNGMTSVILRHCPQLSSVLPLTASAFAPYRFVVR